MFSDITKQKHTSLILEVLKDKRKIRRSDLYIEVMEKQKKRYGKVTTYQVICRDVDRLLKKGIIKSSGGIRSQFLTLK